MRDLKILKNVNGKFLTALLNQTIYKVLKSSTHINLNFSDGGDCNQAFTKTYVEELDRWVSVPIFIYNFFNFFCYEITVMIEVLESGQADIFCECCFKVVDKLIERIDFKIKSLNKQINQMN